ncbi:MAG: WYL domain-containing protein [Fibrobacterales bacterium]
MKKESSKYQRISLIESLLKEREWTKTRLLHQIESEYGDPIDDRTLARYLKEIALNNQDFVRKDNQIGRESTFHIQSRESWIDDDSIIAFKKMTQDLSSSGMAQYQDLLNHVGSFLENRSSPQKLQQSDTHWIISHGPFAVNPDSIKMNPAMDKILQAIDNQQAIRIGKYTSSRDEESMIEFYPVKLVLRIGQLYVMGYGKKNESLLRTLRLDRMKGIIQVLSGKIPDHYFDSTHQKEIQEFYKYKFAQWSNENSEESVERVVLKSKESWFYRHMKDAHFDPAADCDGSKKTIALKLYITVDFERWLVGRVATGACEIVEPNSLKERVESLLP